MANKAKPHGVRVRFTPGIEQAIADYRRRRPDLTSQSQALRSLVVAGLKAEHCLREPAAILPPPEQSNIR